MKIKKIEEIEVAKAETKFGTVDERTNGLGLSIRQKGGLEVIIREDQMRISLPVQRPGHDHGGICDIRIKGLEFVRPEGSMVSLYPKETPTIEFSQPYIPTFKNPEQLRWNLISDLSEALGKQFGYAAEKLIIHAHPGTDMNKDCLTIIGSQGALDRLYKLIQFSREKK